MFWHWTEGILIGVKSTNRKRTAARGRKTEIKRRRNRRRRSRGKWTAAAVGICAILAAGCLTAVLIINGSSRVYASEYEKKQYSKDLYRGTTFAQELCVTSENVVLEGYAGDPTLHAAGLFDVKNKKVLYADRLFDRLYPASTTKVMTAYVALKYGNLSDMVTVSSNATNFAPDEQVCGLMTGDQLSLEALLNGLLLFSGNDCGVAIAEHVSGSVEAFVAQMNAEAAVLGATGTHFTNPHGLQDENHYTTAYDLYLMFNACMQDERFVQILSRSSYTAQITSAEGIGYTAEWTPTNYYASGDAVVPDGVRVLGGKTGTTDEAGSCLILYDEDMQNNPYISIVMGASDKDVLYSNMSQLMLAGIAGAAE